jgi:DNA-binding LytR/AlgR family response regulator
MYQVALCEDEKIFSETQAKICHMILSKLCIEHRLFLFESSAVFWSDFSKGKRYDFILLDIVMDETNGMELARKIRAHDKDAAIVFVTANPDYALQGYDVNALHYLMKPLNPDTLEKLILSDYINRFQKKYLVIKSKSQTIRIPAKDINCLETAGRKVKITTMDGMIEYSGKLSELAEELPKQYFIRCHVGYVVNLGNIRKLNRIEAIAVNEKIIPISRAYSESVQKAFLKQLWET